MQSDHRWLKKLAKSNFKNGKWIISDSSEAMQNPFALLRDDIEDAVAIYNQNTATPIRLLNTSHDSNLIAALLFGSTQLRFIRNAAFLDISMIRVQDFQSLEQPLVRLTPLADIFGYPVWKRGTAELSTDQVIKSVFLQLIEASSIS